MKNVGAAEAGEGRRNVPVGQMQEGAADMDKVARRIYLLRSEKESFIDNCQAY